MRTARIKDPLVLTQGLVQMAKPFALDVHVLNVARIDHLSLTVESG